MAKPNETVNVNHVLDNIEHEIKKVGREIMDQRKTHIINGLNRAYQIVKDIATRK